MYPDKAYCDYRIQTASLLDILSILDIKDLQETDPLKKATIHNEMVNVSLTLKEQLGETLYSKIHYSHEYNALWRANADLFDAINRIKEDKTIPACYLDSLNYARFEAKKILQETFFGELTEQKIGYEPKMDSKL
jgi:hypothetical protein